MSSQSKISDLAMEFRVEEDVPLVDDGEMNESEITVSNTYSVQVTMHNPFRLKVVHALRSF